MVRRVVIALFVAATLAAQAPPVQAPSAPPNAQPNSPAFTDGDGVAVLRGFAGALEAHSVSRFLDLFDANSYPAFPTFSGEMDSYFAHYDRFNIHYNLKQTSMGDNGRGVLVAQIELEEVPVNTDNAVRHNAEVRFEVTRVGDTWKIAAFAPREFLS
jgi:plasmid stability protein